MLVCGKGSQSFLWEMIVDPTGVGLCRWALIERLGCEWIERIRRSNNYFFNEGLNLVYVYNPSRSEE
jgi:hypothetical protein